jgi:glyoxylase-like metal-dependent hydrolase (beta-lactamase superfamily II)
MRIPLLLLALFWSFTLSAAPLALQAVPVTDGVYAVIGDLGNQSYENDGLNANLGFVVGEDAVLVINTGPSRRVAEALHAAIRKTTDKPVKWVVNVNSQNHYWHGNGYFQEQKATLIAHAEALTLMRAQGTGQQDSNKALLKEKYAGTTLAYPTETFTDTKTLMLGKTRVELRHFGNAHTPGDLVVWLPQTKTLFAGDLVFTGRLMAVLPFGSTLGWVTALERATALAPTRVVPGHGQPGTVADANRDTRDYLVHLRAEAKRIFEGGGTIDDAVGKVDQSRFKALQNFDLLAKRNMNIVFQEIEKELF